MAPTDPGPSSRCSSTTREVEVGSYADISTWYDAEGREVRQVRDAYLADGSWLGSSLTEHGYIDGLLVSYAVESETPAEGQVLVGTLLTAYEHDDLGRLIGDRWWYDDELRYTTTFRYDDLGQPVGGERLDHSSGASTVTEQWWSEGRVDRWELRGPEGNVWVYEDYEYLVPSPGLDAEVFGGAYGHRIDRYDGDRLIETEAFGSNVSGPRTWQWVHRDDGQVELERRLTADEVFLTRSEYDAQGRLVRQPSGLDVDGDDGIDELYQEQTWTWTCD